MTSHQCAADHIDHLDEEYKQAVPRLDDIQQNGLDVILEEDARYDPIIDLLALLRHGVLVRADRHGPSLIWVTNTVGCGYDGHEILELVEVRGRRVDGLVEGVDERWKERAEGEFRNDVRKVKCCSNVSQCLVLLAKEKKRL